jgi:3-oxoacyl-[acyl-carrier protein] reductase
MPRATRTALITGSNKNIGRACALALAKGGFNIVVNGAKDRAAAEAVAREVEALGVEALVAMGDVGKREDCARMAKEALARFGTIDALLNNAAMRPDGKFLEMSEADFDRVVDTDYKAAYWLARATLPGMLQKGWGRIVNFAGMNAIHGYNGRAAVSVAKHAAWGLTKALAKEFGPKGITTNIISPGPIMGEAQDPHMAAHIKPMAARVPVGRLGTPDEVAETAAFLVSGENTFMTGAKLVVDGGL